MSAVKPMTSLRRRPMPGMPAATTAPPSAAPRRDPEPPTDSGPTPESPAPSPRRSRSTAGKSSDRADVSSRRHPVEDYSTTHLANFRLPVDLHARYGRLITDAQERHPRLRKMSLTEVVIALLAEGPQTPDEIAELVRRKRIAEHNAEGSR